MKHWILSFLFILGITVLVQAQTGTVAGKVTTQEAAPVEGAIVLLEKLNKVAVTDQNGLYQFQNIPFGTYSIVVNAMGIEAKQIEIQVSLAENPVNITVKSKGAKLIQEVLITGKSERTEIETAGFAVNVLETKEASLRNLQTNELLNRTVGIKVRQSGGVGSEAVYNLNGMSGRAVGVFIDGIEISTYGNSFNLNNIPPALIERIEVYKGVLPAHLSGDFLGGGINIILKKGALQNMLNASVSYGSFNTQQADLSGMYRNPESGFTVKGSGFYTYSDNDYEVWGKFIKNEMPRGQMEQGRGKRFNDAFRSYGGRVELGYTDVKWADNFMLSYNGSYTYNEVQHGQYMSRPYMGRFTESKAHIAGLNYSKENVLVKGLKLTFNGVYSDREEYIQDTVSWRYNWTGEKVIGARGLPLKTLSGAQQGAPTMNTITRKIANLRSGLSYNITDNHRFSINHMYYQVDRHDKDELRTVLEQLYAASSDLSKNVTAAAYEMQAFDAKLKTNLFGKLYQQRIFRTEPVIEKVNGENTRVLKQTQDNRNTGGYGFAVSYAVNPDFVLITSAEKAVRMPAEGEIFGEQAQNLLGNLSLNPEVSNNFNLGFRAGAYKLKDHRISFSTSGFLRNTKDKIVVSSSDRSVTNVELFPYINLAGARAIGFEAEVNYSYKNLNLAMNTSRFNSLLKNEASLYHNRQLPNEPFFTANGNVQYRIDNALQKKSVLNLYYNAGYVHPFETIWQLKYDEFNVTPTQFIQDLGASYMFPNRKVVVSFDAKNIFNREAYDNFAAQKPGRSFYLKLNYTINTF